MTEIQIRLIKPEEVSLSHRDFIVDSVIKKIYPDYSCFSLPSWLIDSETISLYRKEETVLMASLLPGHVKMNDVFALMQLKVNLEASIQVFHSSYRVIIAILSQQLSPTIQKLLYLDKGVQLFELFSTENSRQVFVRELKYCSDETVKEKSEIQKKATEVKDNPGLGIPLKIPEKNYQSESHLKQDASLISFFYKMGKLSEEELTRLLELEVDLGQMNFR